MYANAHTQSNICAAKKTKNNCFRAIRLVLCALHEVLRQCERLYSAWHLYKHCVLLSCISFALAMNNKTNNILMLWPQWENFRWNAKRWMRGRWRRLIAVFSTIVQFLVHVIDGRFTKRSFVGSVLMTFRTIYGLCIDHDSCPLH